jgi:hypothetical protein
MAYMVFLVVQEIELVDAVLEAWIQAGAPGATILDSTGLNRRRGAHIPMPYLYGDHPDSASVNATLFSIVPDETVAKACLQAAETILGDLKRSNTGVFAAWPLALCAGLNKQGAA